MFFFYYLYSINLHEMTLKHFNYIHFIAISYQWKLFRSMYLLYKIYLRVVQSEPINPLGHFERHFPFTLQPWLPHSATEQLCSQSFPYLSNGHTGKEVKAKKVEIPRYLYTYVIARIFMLNFLYYFVKLQRMSGYKDPKFPPNTENGITSWKAMSVNWRKAIFH